MPKTTKPEGNAAAPRARKPSAKKAKPGVTLSQEEIAKRAYELFLRDGQHGRDLEHWLHAERELLGASSVEAS